MKDDKDTILTVLSKDESDAFDTIICKKLDLDKTQIETSTLIKSMVMQEVENINFKEELDNIEKKISKLKVGDEFSLSDLFEKADWDSKESYKKILGKLFKARASKLKYISITDKKKGSSAVYKKTK